MHVSIEKGVNYTKFALATGFSLQLTKSIKTYPNIGLNS